ncbi:MAG: competence/damage-inducible protein A [Rhodospirillales bacterium]|nr:competence/damage-inducible protein A [Rhodospirillales bacterium]
MRCEIVAVGTELLLGQIVDTNSSWMGGQLAQAGIDSHFQVKVGDNQARIVDTIRRALDRSDAVILCGGLGPTQDDITREAIAEVMGVALVRDDAMGEKIRRGFEARGRRFTENNLRQADCPVGASFIPEMPGTAPGLVCPLGKQVIYAVPGVPFEMREMMAGTILPDLKRRAGVTAVIKSRVLKSWGETESRLAELLAVRIDALDRAGNPTIAFQASGIEGLKIRITAKAENAEAAEAIIAREEANVRGIVGDAIFAADEQTMESAILDLLRERGLSLAVAESVTGGLVGARLTAVPGASDVFRGALVSYASEVKFDVLGVPEGPVISADAAEAMARGVRERLGADVGIATTGVAGPAEREGHPHGTVFLGLAHGGSAEAVQVRLPGDRRRVREYAVISLLNMLRLRVSGSSRSPELR